MISTRLPDPLNATATVAINGLALFSRTPNDKFQVAFLKAPKHELTLEIKEISAQGSNVKPHAIDLSANQQLFLSATNPSQETTTTFETDHFHRVASLKDFRWMANLDREVHDQGELEFKNPKDVDITLLTVNNAHFYSDHLVGPMIRVDRESQEQKDYGMVASVVAADISCGIGGKIVIQNAGGANRIDLEQSEGVRYVLTFINTCPEDANATETDFLLNYTVLSDPSGHKFDLLPKGQPLSGSDSCNPGRVSSTKDLSELLGIPTAAAPQQ